MNLFDKYALVATMGTPRDIRAADGFALRSYSSYVLPPMRAGGRFRYGFWLDGLRTARSGRVREPASDSPLALVGPQTGPIPSSFAALAWAIFSFADRGRSTARSQSAPSRLLTNG